MDCLEKDNFNFSSLEEEITLDFDDEYCLRVLLRRHVAELEKAGPTVMGDGDMRLFEGASLIYIAVF